MSNSEYREAQQQAREAGLAKRHEQRLERAQSVEGVHGDVVEVESTRNWIHLKVGPYAIALTPKSARLLAQSLILRAIEIEDWDGSA